LKHFVRCGERFLLNQVVEFWDPSCCFLETTSSATLSAQDRGSWKCPVAEGAWRKEENTIWAFGSGPIENKQ